MTSGLVVAGNRKELCERSWPELRSHGADMTDEMNVVFDIFKFGLMDMNIVKDVGVLKEEFQLQEKEEAAME